MGQGVTADACYINFLKVAVTILGKGPAPPQPQPAVLTADRLRSFAQRLASMRNEWGELVKGMYMALDLVGTRMVASVDRAGDPAIENYYHRRNDMSHSLAYCDLLTGRSNYVTDWKAEKANRVGSTIHIIEPLFACDVYKTFWGMFFSTMF